MGFVDVTDFANLVAGDDWTPAFGAAIGAALAGGHAGVLVPARTEPYHVRAPAPAPGPPPPSIDLRGVAGFTLRGEGERSVVAMVGTGSWRMIHIGGGAADVQIRDLCLDGAGLVDADQQSHLIVVGTSILKPGGARRVSIVNCTISNAAADAVAIVPASSTQSAEEVSDITISDCRLLGSGRSGVSNQRLGRRISILHNRFEGTEDQDIDFEPSGDLPASGPSGYLILGNTMVRTPGRVAAVSVTLSGTSPESPSRLNTFAYNQIYGGLLGLIDAHDTSIVGNYIEAGPKQTQTVVRMAGSVERMRFAQNTVVRTRRAGPGTLLNVSSAPTALTFLADHDIDAASDALKRAGHGMHTGVGPLRAASPGAGNTLPTGLAPGVDYWAIRVDDDEFRLALTPQEATAEQHIDLQDHGAGQFVLTRQGFPRSVSIQGNRLSTHAGLPVGEALINFSNASKVSFRDNEITSLAGHDLAVAVKFDVKKVPKRPIVGWEVVGNRVDGNGRLPAEFNRPGTGSFGVAVKMAVGSETVSDIRVSENTFGGCVQQVVLQAQPPAAFATIPAVMGNSGVGTALVLLGTQAALVGGNQQSPVESDEGETPLPPAGARFCGPGEPQFAAPIGSLYSRSEGSPGLLLYINTDGTGAGWTPIA